MKANSPKTAASHARILVLDDEPDLRTLYELSLLREGHEVRTASTLAEARALLERYEYDVVITDMRLPDGLGLSILQLLATRQRAERCIVITAYGSAENAVEALKLGAFDYLTKPVDLKLLRSAVASALKAPPAASAVSTAAAALAAAGNAAAAAAPETPGDDTGTSEEGRAALERLVGESAIMREVKRRIVKVASSMAPVLVHGESGTGKELVARAIHACSHCSVGPFVPVNCGAIPENLLEAEFFGALKGSYTGITQDRQGFFQAASGGTLFLDEIGDLPLAMQAKLLRAIQERKVRPLGATQEEPVDVRIVSATHKDLAAEVQAGRFRQDLYYRLDVIEINIPPLRERREDLPMLCQVLLGRIGQDTAYTLSPRQLEEIAAQPLEGNVRELENLLHRAVALGEVRASGEPPPADAASDDLPFESVFAPQSRPGALTPPPPPPPPASAAAPTPDAAAPGGELASPPADAAPEAAPADDAPIPDPLPCDLEAWLLEQEKQIIIRALEESNYKRGVAAAKLGLNLRQIRYRMVRLGIIGSRSGAASDDDASDDASTDDDTSANNGNDDDASDDASTNDDTRANGC
ncbi:MAG: sigma-54 dependent transcriptional regulator [Burkholderiaceae bacterium]|jgi:two-component system response regulator PilR (NtrC family)|nr:sigma-54 dependent transcriptional regulator [Burkholderiaceae bacterium]